MSTAIAATRRHAGNLRSIYAMLAAVVMFSLMDTAMKLLAATYPALQVVALRALCSLPLVSAYAYWRGALGSVLQVRFRWHLFRGVIGIASLGLFAYGLKRLSLAEAYSVFFIAPALITALSVFFLGERVDAARWTAIAGGLLGVLVVLRPSGAGMLSVGGLAILGAAACYAMSAVAGRILCRSDRAEHLVFWLMLLMAIGASALAAPGWVAVRTQDWLLLCGLAGSGFLGQLAITEAFSHGEASVVAPFEYSALAWGVGLDWLLWQTLPDRYTLLGAAIIIASGIYLVRHEAVHAEAEHP